MKHHYRDITDKLGEPLWWDEAGVPRYCEFGPRETNDIYVDQVVLLEIACQQCGRRFKVAMSWGSDMGYFRKIPSLFEQIESKEIHYGDPPNYGCCPAGATMNSEPIRVLEAWQRGEGFEWERMAEYEVEIAK